jgi:archaeal flagellin FlaB
MAGNIRSDDRAMTGLESAIVLIAFIVVASVFSYVMLGAGFFVSQKSKQVIHSGIDQVSSSMMLSGPVIGIGDPATGKMTGIMFSLKVMPGTDAVDLSSTLMSLRTSTLYGYVSNGSLANMDRIPSGTSGNVLYPGEMVNVKLVFEDEPGDVGRMAPVAGEHVTMVITPSSGASMTINLVIPEYIDRIMTVG